MTGPAWNVVSSANNRQLSHEMRPAHETKLLHELIIQAVTERKIDVSADLPYDKQLETAVKNVQASAGYKSLLAKPQFNQSEVSTLLDQQHLQRLPAASGDQHVTLMMATGGPATGKTQLLNNLKAVYPNVYDNAAKINPDDYKPLLADPLKFKKDYADIAHPESSKLASDIMVRLEQKMAAGKAPHVVMDVVGTSEHRMNFAKQAGQLVVVTGVVPVDVAVERSFQRGLPDDGRRIPTEVVIAGARGVAVDLPRIFEHPNVEFVLRNNDVKYGEPSKTVAVWNSNNHSLRIPDPETFIGLVERQNLNVKATSPDQLYKPQDRMPQRIAEGLKQYLDRGVRLEFLNANGEVAMAMSSSGVEQNKPLVLASRGLAFMPEVAVATTALLARQGMAEQKRPPHEEHARSETKTPVKTGAAYGAAIPAGIGTGMGIHGLYDAAQPNSSVRRDLDAGGAQAVAGGARVTAQVADVAIGVAATIEGTRRALSHTTGTVAGVANKLPELGPAGKLAARAAVPVAVTTGVLDAAAGIVEGDPERVAGAAGRTAVGVWGGIKGGAAAGALSGFLGGSPSGPGALLSAGIGALGGAVVGGLVGEEGAKEITRQTLSLFSDDKADQSAKQPYPPLAPRPAIAIPPVDQSQNISPDMIKALNAAMGTELSNSIRCDAQQSITSSLPTSQAIPKHQTQNTATCR